jgi:hypothetical protein
VIGITCVFFLYLSGSSQSMAASRISICKSSVVYVLCLSYHGGKSENVCSVKLWAFEIMLG